MKAKKINGGEIAEMKIAALPSRPCAPSSFGGRGYTSVEMKAAFDRLPLYIIDRLNALLDDISADGEDSVAGEIKTGIAEGHTLKMLFSDLTDGSASSYIAVLGTTLAEWAAEVSEELRAIRERLDGGAK